MGRSRPNAGHRCEDHDYCSRCIYHIVLNKRPGFEDFSHISGCVGSHEYPPVAVRHKAGETTHQAISNLKNDFPFVTIQRRCIMPDHVHFSIFIHEDRGIHLGRIIASLKRDCSREWEKLGYPAETRFFSENYYDSILRGNGQLKRMLAYISDNPRRWILRNMHPGWFRRFRLKIGKYEYEAYGNWDLLGEWDINAVKISRRYSEEELVARKRSWVDTVRNDGVLISPFISEKEKKVRNWAIDNGGAIIDISTEKIGDRYKPSGRYFDLCGEGRLLVIFMPPASKNLSRADCERMNALAVFIAEGGRPEIIL